MIRATGSCAGTLSSLVRRSTARTGSEPRTAYHPTKPAACAPEKTTVPPMPQLQLLGRRDILQLAAAFGLSLTVPGLAAKTPAVPLTAVDLALIGEVAELIIPTTDTGGAAAAGVPAFVRTMLSGWFSDADRENFLSGMREFSAGAVRKHGKPFGRLSAAEKDGYFGSLLATAEAAEAPSGHPPFVVLMKRLTIFGYYTSELGATVELRQQIASPHYEPAAAIEPGERADSAIVAALYPFNAS